MRARAPERDGRGPVKLVVVPQTTEPIRAFLVLKRPEQGGPIAWDPGDGSGVSPPQIRAGISPWQQVLDHTAKNLEPHHLRGAWFWP